MNEGVWQYFGVFVSLMMAGMGFPIPEELPVIVGGVAAGHAANQDPRTHPYWYIMLPVCWISVILSDTLLYCIGRYGGRRLLHIGWVQKHIVHPEKRQEIEANFHKYGVKILLGARFLPGIRAPIFVMAGVLHMPIGKFMFADGIYAIPGVGALFGLSYWFTDAFFELYKHIEHKIGAMRHLLILLGIAAVGGVVCWVYFRRRVVTGDPPQLPIIGDVVKPAPETGSGSEPKPAGPIDEVPAVDKKQPG